MALAAGVRPEVHLLVGLAALLAISRAVSQPRARAGAAAGLALAAAILAAMHLTRFAIYHSLVPNTALVKAATFSLRAGLRFVGELLMTGLIGVPLVLAFAEARRRRDDVALVCAGGLALFALYLVRIGNDEMSLSRLFLPVLPLAFGLAACRLSAGAAAPRVREPLVDRAGILVAIVCGAGVLSACFHLQAAGAISRGNRSNAPLARALHLFGRPGDLVVFQDLGRTPYEAMELRFVDPIGLVDREIAHILYRDGAMPFLRAPSPTAQRQIRDRLFALRPRFIVLVAYVAKPDTVEVARRFHAGERQGLLDPWFSGNYYHAGLYDDPRFKRGYQFIDAWQRNVEYYMALYQARPDEPD